MANNDPHWADRSIAIFTGLILVTYITGNYFSCQQLKLTQITLEELKRGGADTHVMVEAARVQADAAARSAKTASDALTESREGNATALS